MKNYAKKLMAIKDIAKRNKAFDKLSRVEKRICIAQDTVTLLDNDNISLGSVYFEVYDVSKKLSQEPITYSLQELDTEVECKMCERGILMFSRARLGNKVYKSTRCRDLHVGSHGTEEALRDIFDISELEILESLFENHSPFILVGMIKFNLRERVALCRDIIIKHADKYISQDLVYNEYVKYIKRKGYIKL